MIEPTAVSSCFALLALELDAGSTPVRLVLDRDNAADLARLIAADLARLLPHTDELGLAVLGAVYDQAQILRPGWPLYAELSEHYTRATRSVGDAAPVFALGAHAGHLPNPVLEPEPDLHGGTMLLIPWMLSGETTRIAEISERMEQDFVAKGEAGAATADWLMRQLGIRLQHARYLTRNDLCALASVQLEHAGFGPLWQLLEGALLAPEHNDDATSASGQRYAYAQHRVSTVPLGYTAWAHSEAAAYFREPQEFARGFVAYLFELRQYAALFKAHALPLHLVQTANSGRADDCGYWIEPVSDRAANTACHVFAHEIRGLGIIVLTVAAISHGEAQTLAHAYPIEPAALAPALAELQSRYATSGEPIRLGELSIDRAQQALAIPPHALLSLPRTH